MELRRSSNVFEENAQLYQEHCEAMKMVKEIIEKQNSKLQERADEVDKMIAAENDNERRSLLNKRKKMEAMLKLLRDEEEAGDSEDGEALDEVLISKEGEGNDEIREAREVLIDGLKDLSSPNPIGVKKMGELECKPFYEAMKSLWKKEHALHLALNMCTLWNEQVRNPKWHPFKAIKVKGKAVEVLDEGDKKLKALKKEMGEKVHNAVITALTEMNEYNPTGRSAVSELWNFKDGRRASLKEGIAFVLNQWEQRKRARLVII